MSEPRRTIPAGRYLCRVVNRRPADQGFEVLAEVRDGKYGGRRILIPVTNPLLVPQAAILEPGDDLEVVLQWRQDAGGKLTPVVPAFRVVNELRAFTVLGGVPSGDSTGEPRIWSLFYDRDQARVTEKEGYLRNQVTARRSLTPAALFPEELRDELESTLRYSDSDVQDAADDQDWDSSKGPAYSILDRMAGEYELCVLQEGADRRRVVDFESCLRRFCRTEKPPAGLQAATVSVYQFGRGTGGPGGYSSQGGPDSRDPVWARWLHVGFQDDGAAEPAAELAACRRFATALQRLGVPRSHILVFTLGAGRLEVMFPSAAFACTARPGFEYVAGYIAQLVADWSALCPPEMGTGRAAKNPQPGHQPIDVELYVPLATVAMPNTWIERTGNFKTRISLRELADLEADEIAGLGAKPRPFNPPSWRVTPHRTLFKIAEYAVAVAVSRSQALDQSTFANRWIHARF
jgi:hypothetical protein